MMMPDLSSAIDKFLAWELEEVKRRTWLRDRSSLTAILNHFGDCPLEKITVARLELYKSARRKDGIAGGSIRAELMCLSKAYRFWVVQGWSEANLVSRVKMPAISPYLDFTISPEQEMLYFTACPPGDLFDLGRLMLLQGMRPSEVLGLAAADIDLESGVLHIRRGKTGAARRMLPLNTESKEILERRIYDRQRIQSAGPKSETGLEKRSRLLGRAQFPMDSASPKDCFLESGGKDGIFGFGGNSSGLLFQMTLAKLERYHRAVCKRIGLLFRLYRFRHTCASRWGRSGMSPHALKALLGHSSYALLPRYVHMDLEAMRDEMQKYQDRVSYNLRDRSYI